ncbi:hypothetical protein Plhal304r1_c054g0138611 [Plasmopara halstedii]
MDMYFSRLTIERVKTRDPRRTRVSPATLHMQELRETGAVIFDFFASQIAHIRKVSLAFSTKKGTVDRVSLSRSAVLSSEHSGVNDCSLMVLQNDPVAARIETSTRMDDMYAEAKALINP